MAGHKSLRYPLEAVMSCLKDIQELISLNGGGATARLSERFPTVRDGNVGIAIEVDGDLSAAAESLIDAAVSRHLGDEAYLDLWDEGIRYVMVGEEEVPLGDPDRPIELGWGSAVTDYPSAAVMRIHRLWGELANSEDDAGSCVLGDRIELICGGKCYRLAPLDGHQGSLPREKYLDEVMSLLAKSGCEAVRYNPGRLD